MYIFVEIYNLFMVLYKILGGFGMKSNKGLITWRIAIVILFIFGMGFFTGKISEFGKIQKLKGYSLGLSQIQEQDAAYEEYATSANIEECATPADCEGEYATPADCEGEYATPANSEGQNTASTGNGSSQNIITNNVEVKVEKEEVQTKYENSTLTAEQISQIKSLEDEKTVTIDASKSSVISTNVFEAIKGSNKRLIILYNDDQIIFEGKDIVSPKAVDVKITKSLSIDAKLKEKVDVGVLIEFADNGNLPGKAIVRLKATDEMKAVLTEKTIALYYYSEDKTDLSLIQTGIVLSDDGFYNCVIEHNSQYVLTNSSVVINNKNEEKIVSFVDNNLTYLIVIGISVFVIIVVVIIVIVVSKSKKSKKDILKDKGNKQIIENDAEVSEDKKD